MGHNKPHMAIIVKGRGSLWYGMGFYILRSDAGALRKPSEKSNFPAEPKAALHKKAAVFDRQSALIGTIILIRNPEISIAR